MSVIEAHVMVVCSSCLYLLSLRFSPKNKALKKVDGITYLPFGEGPRHCIGMRLALVEAKIALVHVLRKVKFERSEKTQVKHWNLYKNKRIR